MSPMKGSSIFEVLLVFIGWRFGFYLVQFYLDFTTFGLLQFIIPVLIIALARRKWAEYGFTTRQWPESTEIGLNAYLLALIPFGAMLVLSLIGIGYQDILGGTILGACSIVTLLLLLKILGRRDRARAVGETPLPPTSVTPPETDVNAGDVKTKVASPSQNALGRKNLVIIVILIAFPILLSLAIRPRPPIQTGDVAYWALWQFFVSGFGEETLYRGYFQSRINAEFGRPYTFKGVQFGPGIFIAAILFAFTHVLNPFDPLNVTFTLALGWGIWTFCSGLFFGFIREKTGDLIGPGIAHGLPDAVGESLYLIFAGTYA